MINKELILAKLKESPYLTGKELSEIIGVSIATANRYIKRFSNLTRSERIAFSNKQRVHNPITITEEANQIIIGSLLGDGSVIRKKTNCIFTILHSKMQIEYAKYKHELLKKSLNVKLEEHNGYISVINNRTIKNNGRVIIKTETNVSFNKYRKEWYSNKKIIPNSVYELNALGLAIWFMDDGTSNNSSFYLSTQCFSHDDQLKLVDMMKKNFDLECHIHKQKDKEILYICAKDRQKFIDIIKPYICSSMNYKIIGHNKQGELLES